MHHGMLSQVLSFAPDLEVFEPTNTGTLKLVRKQAGYRTGQRILWGIWRRLPGSKRSPLLPHALTISIADRLVSRWILPSAIFHGWSAMCLACLLKAKRYNAITLIENPLMHPKHWQNTVLQECDAFGVYPRDCRAILSSRLIHRMEHEYEVCDKIIVPSTTAFKSFEQSGYPGKAIIIHAGVDHHFFTPRSATVSPKSFRVCYVGRVEIAKGIGYLLQAWKQLALADAELVLIGEVAPEMDSIIKQHAQPNVRFLGFLPPAEVAGWYRSSNLFVFPSVNEGLARVLFEAMASALPVIATETSGAEDCVTSGEDGTIVPARNTEALAEAMLWHYQNREESEAMGRLARRNIEQRFTLSHYEERMIALYRSL